MRHVKYYIYIFTATLMLLSTGCKKFLDVNKNLNDPIAVPVSTLLSSSERSLAGALALSSGLSSGLSAYVHQMTGRSDFDRYSIKGTSTFVTTPWTNMYRLITQLDVIINQATTEGRFVYAGVAKILKAYTYSQMVDVWGDIPFSEFNQFKAGVLQPKFDDDATIYPQLLTLIDAGIADINNTALNPSSPAADDVIYGGNKTKWIKAANTIKLKLYTQLRLKQNVTAQVTALLASPTTLIRFHNEDFLVPFGPFGATDDRHPGYSDYTATQRGSQLISPWFYEILKGRNANILNGLVDPRIPYYMYNQKTATGLPENKTEYRDGGFVSIVFGSSGPYKDGSNSNTYTMFGIYPVGGRYDDGAGTSISGTGASSPANAGTGAAPQRMITYPDRLYLEAELIQTGVIAGDARAVFNSALIESFKQVDTMIINYIKTVNQTIPSLYTQASVATYIAGVLAQFDAGTAAKKLEIIMTEKWIQAFGNGVDQWTDYRRTGYPVLFDPNNTAHAPGGFVQPPLTGNPQVNPQEKIPVFNNVPLPLSLPWSQTERELNSNAPAQKAPEQYKIFWMP